MIWCVEDDASIRDIEVYALRATGWRPGLSGRRRLLAGAAERKAGAGGAGRDAARHGRHGAAAAHAGHARPAAHPRHHGHGQGAEYDKVQGLDRGADDYLTKPFGVMELVSRVQGGAAPLPAAGGAGTLRCRRADAGSG